MAGLSFVLVKTGNGYAADLAATGAKFANDTGKEVKKLIRVIQGLDVKNDVLQKKVFWLTISTAFLAIAQLIVGVIQLFK